METNKTGKRFSDADKVAILRRHLLEKEPISKICDELSLQPTQFYLWQKTFFENGAAAFQARPRGEPIKDRRIAQLENQDRHDGSWAST
ncbi:MAG: transposase [Magnetococcus sp. YQC-5]